MKPKAMQVQVYKINLNKVGKEGDFLCPKCGVHISPDDCSEAAYSIIDVHVASFGLEHILIHCRKCASLIQITGSSSIQRMIDHAENVVDKEKTSNSC